MSSCQNCRFWDFTPPDVSNLKAIQIGLCRRRAPEVQLSEKLCVPRWPMTQQSDWCGDYQATEEESDDFNFDL
jgi:hypothetical protein